YGPAQIRSTAFCNFVSRLRKTAEIRHFRPSWPLRPADPLPAVGIKPNLIPAAVTRWHEFACAKCCTLLASAGAHSRDMALGKPDHRADRGLVLDAGRNSHARSGRLRPVRD